MPSVPTVDRIAVIIYLPHVCILLHTVRGLVCLYRSCPEGFHCPATWAIVAYFFLVIQGALFTMAEWKNLPSMWHAPKGWRKGFLVSGGLALLIAFAGIRPDRLIIVAVSLGILACIFIGFSGYLQREHRNIAAFLLVMLLGSSVVGLAAWHVWPILEPDLRIMPTHVWFENSGTEVKADVLARNQGEGTAHGQIFFNSAICISDRLQPWGEDKIFNRLDFCDGGTTVAIDRNGQWVKAEEHTLTPGALMVGIPNWKQEWPLIFRQQRLIYVVARIAFDDNHGRMEVESCFYYIWPDLQSPNHCFGHNGPKRLP